MAPSYPPTFPTISGLVDATVVGKGILTAPDAPTALSVLGLGSTPSSPLYATSQTVSGPLAAGASSLASLSVTGASNLSALTVSGSTGLAALSATAATLASLGVSGATTLSSLGVSGTSSLATLGVSGAATLSSMTVAGVSTLTTLGVTGATTLSSLSVSGYTTLTTLACSGTATILTANVTGALSGSTATFTGIVSAATPADGANNTQLATTAFVNRAVGEAIGGDAAAPTTVVGLSAKAGVATTFMRSDAAPALDQTISPTWTGAHAFNSAVSMSNTLTVAGALSGSTATFTGALSGSTAIFTGALSASSATFTGLVVATTPADGSNNTQLATTAFVVRAVNEALVADASAPSAIVGLVAKPGVATTFMRSDAAPALDQTIAPTWTGVHTFTGSLTATGSTTLTSLATAGAVITGGSINSTPIGNTTASTVSATTLSASGALTVSGAATLSNTLAVTGATQVGGVFTVVGTTNLNGLLQQGLGTSPSCYHVLNAAASTFRATAFQTTGVNRWQFGTSNDTESTAVIIATNAAQAAAGTTLTFNSTTSIVVGQFVYGTSIPLGTTVASIVANTSVTLSVSTTAIVASGANITFSADTGATFNISNYADNGTLKSNVLSISRATGVATVSSLIVTNTKAYPLRLSTPGVTNSETPNLTFYSTFGGAITDHGPRRTADIIAGFNGGSWGTEYLSLRVGLGGSADDSAALTNEIARFNSSGMTLTGGLTTTSAASIGGSLSVTGSITSTGLQVNGSAAVSGNLTTTGNVFSLGSQTAVKTAYANFYCNGTSTNDAEIVVSGGTAGTSNSANVSLYAGGFYVNAPMYTGIVYPSYVTITSGATQASPFVATSGSTIFVNKTTGSPTYITLPNGGEVRIVDAKGDCQNNPITMTIPSGSGSTFNNQSGVLSYTMSNQPYEAVTIAQNGSGYYVL